MMRRLTGFPLTALPQMFLALAVKSGQSGAVDGDAAGTILATTLR